MQCIDGQKINDMHYIILASDNDKDIGCLTDAFQSRLSNLALKSFATASDTMQYLSALTSHDLPELFIMDQHLPDQDAHSLVINLRKTPLLRRIPIVVISGFIPGNMVRELYRDGANCFISKPAYQEEWHHIADCLQTLFLGGQIE